MMSSLKREPYSTERFRRLSISPDYLFVFFFTKSTPVPLAMTRLDVVPIWVARIMVPKWGHPIYFFETSPTPQGLIICHNILSHASIIVSQSFSPKRLVSTDLLALSVRNMP